MSALRLRRIELSRRAFAASEFSIKASWNKCSENWHFYKQVTIPHLKSIILPQLDVVTTGTAELLPPNQNSRSPECHHSVQVFRAMERIPH